MQHTYLKVDNGSPVRVDADLIEQLRKYLWRHVGGRVISIKSPDFSAVFDLATVVGGAGAVAHDAHDYRRAALSRVQVGRGVDRRIELIYQSVFEG